MKRHFFLYSVLLILFSGCRGTTSNVPPTATAVPPTVIPATPTAIPATNTAVPNTPTSPPPTETAPAPVTATAIATDEPVPTVTTAPTDTPIPPTATATATMMPEAIIDVPGASVPEGFSFVKYADIFRPTALAFDANGRLYATSVDGTIHVFSDTDQNGRADEDVTFSSGFNTPLGITVHEPTGDVYVSSNTKISVLRDVDGDLVADEVANFVNDLPVGLHQNDNLKFGPDGLLYIGVGSTCDVCYEDDPRSATIMRFDINTQQGEVFATGLRNPYDLAFHPLTGALFATDNGRDDLGLEVPREELNHIVQGSNYGWPDCWDDGQGSGCTGTETAVSFFESHASANSIDFYTGNRFPANYRYSAYVAVFGSWLKDDVKTGVVRVILTPNGDSYTSQQVWFATWPGAMPLGLIEGPDGALYVGDFINGGIYRISYG